MSDAVAPKTYSIPQAGKMINAGKNLSYELAKSGVMPTMPVGTRKRRVPAAVWDRIIETGALPAKQGAA